MTRPLLSLLAAAVTAALLARSAAPAHACSPIPDPPHPLDRNDVVIEGRVTGWTRFERSDFPETDGQPIEITLQVQKVYKGPESTRVTFIDVWSLERGPDEGWGVEPPCGSATFRKDPTGQYLVAGLLTAEKAGIPEGYFLLVESFFAGDEPDGEGYDAALKMLSRPDGTPVYAVGLAALVLAAATAFAATVLSRRRGEA
jgi:hypothetical protein